MPSIFANGPRHAKVSERITATTASVGLTAATYNRTGTSAGAYDKVLRPEEALVTVETASIRWTADGTTPTTTATTAIGHLAAEGDAILITGYENITKFRCINGVNASGAAIYVTYFY